MRRPPPAPPTGPASVVLDVSVHLVFHAILATSLFFLFSGHNAPGGGFIGGLVAGTAFVLRYLVSSGEALEGDVPIRPASILGLGLLAAVAAGVASWLAGGQLLESALVYRDIPVLGEVPFASVLVFDAGVYLIVVGLVLGVLSSLAAQAGSSLGSAVGEP